MTFTFLLILACCIAVSASVRVKARHNRKKKASGPLQDFLKALSSFSADIQETCTSESREFFDLFKSDRYRGMVDMPDGIMAQIEAQANSASESQQFEAVNMMSDIAAEVARQGQVFDAQAKGEELGINSVWTQQDAMSVLKGAERCEIILALASGSTARSLAEGPGGRYVLPHERADFSRQWTAAAGDEAKLQRLEKLMVDSFQGMMEKCSIITQGKIRAVDGLRINYAGYHGAYSSCAQLVQSEREDRRTGMIFPSPWWEKHATCTKVAEHAAQVVQARTQARARTASQPTQPRSADTYVPRSNATRAQAGSWLEVAANTTFAAGDDEFALVELEGKTNMSLAVGDNAFFRIHREIQRSGVLSTTLAVLQELAQMGANLIVRVTRGVASVIKGTFSLVVGVLLAFPRWLLFARDKHKTFGIGVADDGLKVWPWCWVVPREPHSLFNRRMCR